MQGVPQHLIRVLQRVCYGQHGEIVGVFGQNDQFPITGGVRQGCVLGPRLFSAVLELAMRKWGHAVGQAGIDLMDGVPHLIDLRFADDILLFARSRHELGQLIGSLNAEKRYGKIIASPLAMTTGVCIVYYPARNHTNNNIDANMC